MNIQNMISIITFINVIHVPIIQPKNHTRTHLLQFASYYQLRNLLKYFLNTVDIHLMGAIYIPLSR